jgi:hypothetical protein
MYNKCLHKRVDETKVRVPIDSRIVQDGEYTKGSEILYSTINCVCAANLIPEESRLCTHAQVLQWRWSADECEWGRGLGFRRF